MINIDEKKELGYFERNRWIIVLLVALMVLCSQEIIGILDAGFKIPDILVYAISGIALVVAGILNAMAGTTSAKLFRFLVVAVLAVALSWFLYEKFL